ncbi:MAG: GNAT family N-acetyltransferase [Planctomycetota bacterium]
MSTPEAYLDTCFRLDERGRIVSTRTPNAEPGPLFILAGGPGGWAWRGHAALPDDLSAELGAIARSEPMRADLRRPPIHADRYVGMLRSWSRGRGVSAEGCVVTAGPAFEFPMSAREGDRACGDGDGDGDGDPQIVMIDDEGRLNRAFSGWVEGEIAGGCGPVMGIEDAGVPVSVCFCARSSPSAAEAGVNTAPAYRGRGYAGRVVAAWARRVSAQGRTPRYSTRWDNLASRRVASKLGLTPYASTWSVG